MSPFTKAVEYDGKGCLWNRQPIFAHHAAGNVIRGISRRFPRRRVTVHAGHCHSAKQVQMTENLSIEVAVNRSGKLAFQEMIKVR